MGQQIYSEENNDVYESAHHYRLHRPGRRIHFTPNRTPVATISVATKESWKNEQGEWQSRTEWHRVVAFGKLGEYAKTLAKGSHVLVQGALRSREYEKDGVKHRVVELRADSIGKLDRAVRREEGESRSEEA